MSAILTQSTVQLKKNVPKGCGFEPAQKRLINALFSVRRFSRLAEWFWDNWAWNLKLAQSYQFGFSASESRRRDKAENRAGKKLCPVIGSVGLQKACASSLRLK
jgi:hypothetical protein